MNRFTLTPALQEVFLIEKAKQKKTWGQLRIYGQLASDNSAKNCLANKKMTVDSFSLLCNWLKLDPQHVLTLAKTKINNPNRYKNMSLHTEILETQIDNEFRTYLFEDDTSVTVDVGLQEIIDMDGMSVVPDDKLEAIDNELPFPLRKVYIDFLDAKNKHQPTRKYFLNEGDAMNFMVETFEKVNSDFIKYV